MAPSIQLVKTFRMDTRQVAPGQTVLLQFRFGAHDLTVSAQQQGGQSVAISSGSGRGVDVMY